MEEIRKAIEDLSKKLILKFTEKEKLMFELGFYRGYMESLTWMKNK